MSDASPRRRRRRRNRRKRGPRTTTGEARPTEGERAREAAAVAVETATLAASGGAPTAQDASGASTSPAPKNGRGRAARPPRLEESAGGIVVRVVDGQPRVLIIRDSYRNWGFPKGHLEAGETAADAALREVQEETGLADLALLGAIDTIDWHFRFRGRLVHKTCHFFLMETRHARTRPQRSEGITACRWVSIPEAESAISYANAREVLRQARGMLVERGHALEGPAANPVA